MLNVSGSLFLLLHVSVDISHGKFISRKSGHMHHTNFPGYYDKRVPYNHTLRKLKGQHSQKNNNVLSKEMPLPVCSEINPVPACRHTIWIVDSFIKDKKSHKRDTLEKRFNM